MRTCLLFTLALAAGIGCQPAPARSTPLATGTSWYAPFAAASQPGAGVTTGLSSGENWAWVAPQKPEALCDDPKLAVRDGSVHLTFTATSVGAAADQAEAALERAGILSTFVQRSGERVHFSGTVGVGQSIPLDKLREALGHEDGHEIRRKDERGQIAPLCAKLQQLDRVEEALLGLVDSTSDQLLRHGLEGLVHDRRVERINVLRSLGGYAGGSSGGGSFAIEIKQRLG